MKGTLPHYTIITLIIVIIVLGIAISTLGKLDFTGRIEKAMSDAEKLAESYKEAESLCPGVDSSTGAKRLSEPIYEQVNYIGRKRWAYRVSIEGNWECNILGGAEGGECYVLGLYSRFECEDGGPTCAAGENRANFEFEINDSDGNIIDNFFPNCMEWNVEGCCIKPTKMVEDGFWCDWYRYQFLWSPEPIPRLKPGTYKIWSQGESRNDWWASGNRVKSKCEGCNFKEDDNNYRKHELNITYSICCPEGLFWNETENGCCSDVLCQNLLCENNGGKWMKVSQYYGCWVNAPSGMSCDDACNAAGGMVCDADMIEKTKPNCDLQEKFYKLSQGYNCNEATYSTNNLAPYNSTPTDFFYLNGTASIDTPPNHFECSSSGSVERFCPCKISS